MTGLRVAAEYLAGIKAARALWRQLSPPERAEMAPDILTNIKATMKRLSPGPAQEELKGERDFWANQLRKRWEP